MEEVTIKVNKTVIYSAGFLIVGVVIGLMLGNFVNVSFSKKDNSGQVALNNLPAQNQPAAQNPQPTAAPSPQITLTAAEHLRGAKNAPVTIVEYSDFQCPYCKRHYPTMLQVMKDYGGKVAWVYRHFPLSFHQNAEISAEASECASEQGKFWEYADMLFTKGNGDGTGLAPTDLEKYAKELGLNFSKFESCFTAKKYASRVNSDQASGSAAGVNGTPANIIIDRRGKTQLVEGAVPYEQLKAAIDAALQ